MTFGTSDEKEVKMGTVLLVLSLLLAPFSTCRAADFSYGVVARNIPMSSRLQITPMSGTFSSGMEVMVFDVDNHVVLKGTVQSVYSDMAYLGYSEEDRGKTILPGYIVSDGFDIGKIEKARGEGSLLRMKEKVQADFEEVKAQAAAAVAKAELEAKRREKAEAIEEQAIIDRGAALMRRQKIPSGFFTAPTPGKSFN